MVGAIQSGSLRPWLGVLPLLKGIVAHVRAM